MTRSPSTVAVIVVVVAGGTAPAASGAWSGPAGPLQWHRILFLLTDRISFPSLHRCRRLYHALLLLASAEASATPTARMSTGRNVRQARGNMGQRSGRHLVAHWCGGGARACKCSATRCVQSDTIHNSAHMLYLHAHTLPNRTFDTADISMSKCNINVPRVDTNRVSDIHCYYIQKIVQIIDAACVENACVYVCVHE